MYTCIHIQNIPNYEHDSAFILVLGNFGINYDDGVITGYQKELTFQRSDGSFSAFGNSDPAGSVWSVARLSLTL